MARKKTSGIIKMTSTTCIIVTVFAVLFLVAVIKTDRSATIDKEGFVEYIVYGPPWWHRGWRRRWFYGMPPPRAYYSW
jgi:hypothetical protein